MWKDFFYYNRSQRRAVCVLLILIALLLVCIMFVPEAPMSQRIGATDADSTELNAFEQKVKQPQRWPRKEVTDAADRKKSVVLKPFDPNLADSIELSSLGLPSFVVRNIMKYRQKGGHFRTVESLARVYGLTEEKFTELKPYVRIAHVEKNKPEKRNTVVRPVWKERRAYKYPEGTLVDVNTADTAELKKVPGIGSGIAKAIVSYRERLGGFCSVEQLEEVDYVTPALLKWFKLETLSVRKLDINKMTLDALRFHPYFNFYQAKVIVEHRRKKGPIKSLSQLALYEEFTEKDLKRLSAYINFD